MGLLADPQETLPYHSGVVGEVRQTNAMTRERTMRRRDIWTMGNFYYEVMHNLLRTPADKATKATTLQHMKAKITRHHHTEQKVYSSTVLNVTD